MVRTRFAPSPTGYMHIGNLRTALYEFLIAKHNNGSFILRLEDTDQVRFVEGSVDVIYNTLKLTGLQHDEGPDIGGDYGPYIQSERKSNYLEFAKQLVEESKAYYCFCTKERLDTLVRDDLDDDIVKYDRHCVKLSKQEIEENLKNNMPYVIRQLIPEGKTTFKDLVYGDITVDNSELDDQILIKSDGLPTYNFANVIDDHLMKITHVIRGSEYLSSTPKYNLLYDAFSWDIPIYMHLPLILNKDGNKLSKRKGDASFEDLLAQGFLSEAVINYIALLGWAPAENREIFSLDDLIKAFDGNGISKSPSIFDTVKLSWFNSEYFKLMDIDEFFQMSEETLKDNIKRNDINIKKVAEMVKTRITFIKDIPELVDFIDNLPNYSIELFNHKKMKTNSENSLEALLKLRPLIESLDDLSEKNVHDKVLGLVAEMEVKNGQVLWPLRTALSGKPSSPCGATELVSLLGKEDSLKRIDIGIEKLKSL